MPIRCTEGSWKHFLFGKPQRWALWETKRFPQYPLCQKLYDGTLATGEYASSSTAPAQTQHDADCSSIPESVDHGGSEVNFNNHELLESECCEEEPSPVRKSSKRSAATLPKGSGTVKRLRPSMASAMVSEMQQFRESGQNEITQIVNALKDNFSQQPMVLSASEMAVDQLQQDFDTVLGLEDMAIACEIMEDNVKASLFLRMKSDVKQAWLARQISKQIS
ncbi:unnamed protein product [Aphanomyces euteiches]